MQPEWRSEPSNAAFSEADLTAAYRAHASSIRKRLRRRLSHADDAEEALQEVFLRAWHARDRPIRSLDGFLYGVADKVALERLRDRRRHGLPRAVNDNEPDLPDFDTPEGLVAARQVYGNVQKMLDALRPARSRAYRLYLDGATQSEVAAELGVSRAMARKHIDAARVRVQAVVDPPTQLPAPPVARERPGTRRGSIMWPAGVSGPLASASRLLLRFLRRCRAR